MKLLSKMICVLSISLLTTSYITACSTNTVSEIRFETEKQNETNKNGDNIVIFSKELDFLYEHYNIQPEEVAGLDLARLFEAYGFDETDYTEEAVRRILRTQGKYYIYDGTSELMSIFKLQNTTNYSVKKNVVQIGYQCIFGNRPYIYIFQLDKKKAYNYKDEFELSSAQSGDLLALLADADVASWKHYYGGEESPSTGSLSWKLVLVLENGDCCIYEGYTGDGSHLPDSFDILANGLHAIMTDILP